MRAKMTRLEKTARKIVRENLFDIDIVLGNTIYSADNMTKGEISKLVAKKMGIPIMEIKLSSSPEDSANLILKSWVKA